VNWDYIDLKLLVLPVKRLSFRTRLRCKAQ
jgi:hypothetical protein